MEFLKDVAAELAATILIGCGVVSWKYRTQEAREALWVAVARWRTAMFRKVSKLLGRARGAPRGAIIVYALGISCCIGTFAGIALEPAKRWRCADLGSGSCPALLPVRWHGTGGSRRPVGMPGNQGPV